MKLCLTLSESELSVLQRKIDFYCREVDLIEVRFDALDLPGIPRLPRERARYVATCRPAREGGAFLADERQRLETLQAAARAGFDWIDLEHDVTEPPEFPASTRLIRSRHLFAPFPADFRRELNALSGLPGDLVKLAVQVSSPEQLTCLLDLMESLPDGMERIVIGMGQAGQPSRFLGAFLGNRWTYVAEQSQSPAAPGQFGVNLAKACFERDWPAGQQIQVYGVLGRPLSHSISPLLHNKLFDHYRLSKIYLPFELQNLESWFGFLEGTRLPFGGFSVTLPFKHEVLRFAESVDSPVDAINTLVRTETGWAGSNTDFAGFLKPLRSQIEMRSQTALVLGCGGVARTVVEALKGEGASVCVMARDPKKAAEFAFRHQCNWIAWTRDVPPARLLVNATPVGQHPAASVAPLTPDQLNFEMVYDLVYHPRETLLLERARRRGARTLSGIEMFVEQAALQFKTWTGIEPDRVLMGAIVEEALGRADV